MVPYTWLQLTWHRARWLWFSQTRSGCRRQWLQFFKMCGCPERRLGTGLITFSVQDCDTWATGCTRFYSVLKKKTRQTGRHKQMHGDTKRTEEKLARKINGGDGGGKNNLSSSLLPAPPRWPCLWFPACACCRPAIPPLSRSSPGKKKKKKKEQKGEWGCQLRNPPCAGVAEESHRHPGSRFLQDNALPTYEIYPWMNELPGEQMNYPWVMLFICRLMGRMGRCVHTNS